MSIRYILGRSGSGKSTVVLDEIRERLLAGDGDHPLVLLVPEQSTFQAEYALVRSLPTSGFMRAQVLSFRRLAYRVMQETGGIARVHIADNGKKMLLHKLLGRLSGELRIFGQSVEQPGFIEKLSDMLVEFKRYCTDSCQLGEEWKKAKADPDSGELADKLHDLYRISEAYEKEIAGLYVDAEDDLAMLAEQFGSSSYSGKAEIWIDGFNGFTPHEYEALTGLIRYAARVNIALCINRMYDIGEEPDALEMFHPTIRTLLELRRIAAVTGTREEDPKLLGGGLGGGQLPRFIGSPMLADMEQMLAIGKFPDKQIAYIKEDITIIAATHRRAEAEAVARRMVTLVRDTGCRWRDMTVLVRNIEDYRDALSTVLSDYGIPYFHDQKRSIAHHPLLELIRASLETVLGGWRYDSVFRAIKSGLLQPIDLIEDEAANFQIEIDQLENYVLAFGIQGSRWTSDMPWTFALRASLEEDEDAGAAKQRERLQRINEVRARLTAPLKQFESRLKAAANARQMAEAVYGLLTAIDAAEHLNRWSEQSLHAGDAERARLHAGVWDHVIDTLDQLVEMMGDETIKLQTFAELIDTGFEHIKMGLVPPSLDQVLIGTMERSRPATAKHLFILGASDGVLPAAMKEDGILTERERDKLERSGIQLAPGNVRRLLDEQFMIYSAVTLASESLWISYPLADDEGKGMRQSEVVSRIARAFPQLDVRREAGESPGGQKASRIEEEIVHPGAVLSALSARLKQSSRGETIAPYWWHAYNWFASQPEWRGKLAARVSSLFYTNREERMDKHLSKDLYGGLLTASVSRMETFAACHFAHFASYGLRLRERKLYKLEAPDIGQLFHAALSLIGNQLRENGQAWGSLSESDCAKLAAETVELLSPRLQSEILFSSSRYRYIAGKLQRIVGNAASALAEHGRRSAFEPVGLEIDFGRGGPLPPLRYTLGDGTVMEIAGRIDRVDRADTDKGVILRIVDYKSSATRLNMTEVYYGLSLQMLTYLEAVIAHSRTWIGTDARPGGMLYFHVHQPLIRAATALSAEDAEHETLKRFKMKGLVLGDEEVVRMMDMTLATGHSEVIPVGIKADGSFYKNSSVMSDEGWRKLSGHTKRTIRRIGAEIQEGKVDIAPYRLGTTTACQMCSFRSVCHFDPLVAGNRYDVKIPYNQDEVWALLDKEGGDSQ